MFFSVLLLLLSLPFTTYYCYYIQVIQLEIAKSHKDKMFAASINENFVPKYMTLVQSMINPKDRKGPLLIEDKHMYHYKKLQMMYMFSNNFKSFDIRAFDPLVKYEDLLYTDKKDLQTQLKKWLHVKPADCDASEAKFLKESIEFFHAINVAQKGNILQFKLLDVFLFDQLHILQKLHKQVPHMLWSRTCIHSAAAMGSFKVLNYIVEDLVKKKNTVLLQTYFDHQLFQSILSNPTTGSNVYNWMINLDKTPTINQYCNNFISMPIRLLESVYELYELHVFDLTICQALAFEVIKYKCYDRHVYPLLDCVRLLIASKDDSILSYSEEEEQNAYKEKRDLVDTVATYGLTRVWYNPGDWSAKIEVASKISGDAKIVYKDLLYSLNTGIKEGFAPDMSNFYWQEFFKILGNAYLNLAQDVNFVAGDNIKYITKYLLKHQERTQNVWNLMYKKLPDTVAYEIQGYIGVFV